MAEAVMEIVDAGRRAATMLHPLRLRLLQNLQEPDSSSGLARRLDLPRQKVNYHLRALEKEDLVEFVEERRKGNCVERVVRAKATTYLIDPHILGRLAADPKHVKDRFSANYLIAVAVRTIRDLATLLHRARKAGKRLATFTLQVDVRFATAADQTAFTEALSNSVAQLVKQYHDETAPKGRLFRFIVGSYPAITKKEDNGETPDKEERN